LKPRPLNAAAWAFGSESSFGRSPMKDGAIGRTVHLKSDARLVREWNGVTHVVDRRENGFLYRGKTYRSLSAIAKEITGAKWSGPRFFGLKGSA
jgi:hypothetical protein